MMPPPKARPKSHSDTSEELRKNLIDCGGSSSCDNSFFQEELHKFFKDNEDQEFKRIDDELSISKSNESYLNEKSTNYNNSNNFLHNNSPSINSNNHLPENKTHINSFNFNMVNYLYNDIYELSEENNHEYKKTLEKLKHNLTKESKSYSKFINLPTPVNNKEIKIFVHNLEKYISDHLFDSIFKNLQIKLQTRYNDYKNKGLNLDYFKETLDKMQKELISRICKQTNGDKKIEIGLNFKNIINNFNIISI